MGVGSWLRKIGRVFRAVSPGLELLVPQVGGAINLVEQISERVKHSGKELPGEAKEDLAVWQLVANEGRVIGDDMTDAQEAAVRNAIRANVALMNAFKEQEQK